MKILVCGDRNWDQVTIIRNVLGNYKDVELIHGGCRGADHIAGLIGKELGWKVTKYPAEWTIYGKAAGPMRNQQMIDAQPDLVIAFHPNLGVSKGTKDTVRRARKSGIEVKIVDGAWWDWQDDNK